MSYGSWTYNAHEVKLSAYTTNFSKVGLRYIFTFWYEADNILSITSPLAQQELQRAYTKITVAIKLTDRKSD